MIQKTIEYDLDGKPVRLTVARATALVGMRRSMLVVRGFDEVENEPDEAVKVLRTITYPALISCTSEAEGIPWPLSFEDFLNIPDDLLFAWESVVYEINPHWNPAGQVIEEQEKKAELSTSDLPDS